MAQEPDFDTVGNILKMARTAIKAIEADLRAACERAWSVDAGRTDFGPCQQMP